MTRSQIEESLQTGFNPQGRRVSESMRVKYLAALSGPQAQFRSFQYRGMIVDGKCGKYFVDGLPHMIFTSTQGAKDAIDRCLTLRAELEATR